MACSGDRGRATRLQAAMVPAEEVAFPSEIFVGKAAGRGRRQASSIRTWSCTKPQGPAAAQLSPDMEELPRLTAWHAVPLITGLSERPTEHRAQDLHVTINSAIAPTAHISCHAPSAAPGRASRSWGGAAYGAHDMVQPIPCIGTRLLCCFCLPENNKLWPTPQQHTLPVIYSHHWTTRGPCNAR